MRRALGKPAVVGDSLRTKLIDGSVAPRHDMPWMTQSHQRSARTFMTFAICSCCYASKASCPCMRNSAVMLP